MLGPFKTKDLVKGPLVLLSVILICAHIIMFLQCPDNFFFVLRLIGRKQFPVTLRASQDVLFFHRGKNCHVAGIHAFPDPLQFMKSRLLNDAG